MVEVQEWGAFNVNSIGIQRRAFPLTFSAQEAGGSWMVTATAAQASELVDVLAGLAAGTVLIADLESNSFVDEGYRPWSPSRIAAAQGVACTVHTVGEEASGTQVAGQELLQVAGEDLPRFVDGTWSPYQILMVDLPTAPAPAELVEIMGVLGTAVFGEPLLPRLTGAGWWFSGHDDCYLGIESTDPAVPAVVLSRLLALLAGASLTRGGGGEPVEVPEPDVADTTRMVSESPHWIGVLGDAPPGQSAVHLTALSRPWRLGDELPGRVDRTATLHRDRGMWEFTPGRRAA